MVKFLLPFIILSFSASSAWAGVDGALSGSVVDPDGIAVTNVRVEVLSASGSVVGAVTTSATGEFQIFPLTFGGYEVVVKSAKFAPYRASVKVSSGGATMMEIHLSAAKDGGKEMVLEVKAKKHLIQTGSAVSSTEINKEQINEMPQGNEVSLPKLLTSTMPGVIAGPFNQTYFRGNHANIQYQIDGVQLPDSPSGTFGEAVSPRNVDHMEVITGGIPAEYGQRLAAVVNMVTKSGEEKPGGEVELNYGSYDTMSPHLMYGGSNESGALHYFASANYHQTSRGLDTPQPASVSNELQGGTDAVHDDANGNNEFLKLDWLYDNTNKLTLVLSNAQNHFEIPNFPGSFSPTDPIFQSSYADRWGNPGFVYVPSYTNDSQDETNAYIETIWKHTFADRSYLQVAPYYKYSYLHFQNDPVNDLVSGSSNAASFYESRNTGNVGIKADYTKRLGEQHEFKLGTQVQSSRSTGTVSVQTPTVAPVIDSNPDSAVYTSVYAQDDITWNKQWTFNLGLRYDATQFNFAGANPSDGLLQPRIGVNYMVTETTKLHAFYGKLFQPAPVEDLRDTFSNTNSSASCPKNQLCPYDIKAEKDDYFEIGIAQQFLERQVALLNIYYKNAQNMLDDTQLLNTAIAQPYNFQKGFAYGVEFSLKGEISSHWSEYFNYSYDIAKGYGINGGIFAFNGNNPLPPNSWQYLDHVQIHTANAGLTYSLEHLWWTTQALYGSGLRTDPTNGSNLPGHLSFDTSVGYKFTGEEWYERFKVSLDVLNIFNNVYPLTIANGFNGSHYAAGQEFFVHLVKEL